VRMKRSHAGESFLFMGPRTGFAGRQVVGGCAHSSSVRERAQVAESAAIIPL
jgi:hypothetical protein